MDLEHSADARAVVDAVLRLAHALGLKVVAEGVENQRQQQILSSLGCDELQGYLFARPMSARALLIWALGEGRQEESFNTSLFGVTREAAPTIPHAVAG
jgi:EAL domain-containing protein (putative c-di-GMP-specific phosphodiesterase class I)